MVKPNKRKVPGDPVTRAHNLRVKIINKATDRGENREEIAQRFAKGWSDAANRKSADKSNSDTRSPEYRGGRVFRAATSGNNNPNRKQESAASIGKRKDFSNKVIKALREMISNRLGEGAQLYFNTRRGRDGRPLSQEKLADRNRRNDAFKKERANLDKKRLATKTKGSDPIAKD